MEGKFLSGVLLGSMVGAAIAANWESISQKCPCLNELKNHQPAAVKSKTRLMARRHRASKDSCC